MNKKTKALTTEQYKEIIQTMKEGFCGCRPNERIATALVLEGKASSLLDLTCDRCGKEFSREKVVPLNCLLATELEDEENDEIVLLEGNEVDLDEVAGTAFILEMDTKNLCSDNCKGLCAKCGANLNNGPCGCRPEVDPRLAALAQLLDD